MAEPSLPAAESSAASTAAALETLQVEACCSVCLDYLKEAVVIECGHNFCKACITGWWKDLHGRYPCPVCRKTSRHPRLWPNGQLDRMVQVAKQLPGVKRKSRDESLRCSQHQEPLSLFCYEDQEAVCRSCATSHTHQEHRLGPLDEASREYEEKLQACLVSLEQKLKDIADCRAAAEKKSRDLKRRMQSRRQQVFREFQELHRRLDKEEQTLLEQVEEEEHDILQRLQERAALLRDRQQDLSLLAAEVEERCSQAGLQILQNVPAQAGLQIPQDVPAQAGLRIPQDVPAQAGLQVPHDVPAQAGLRILQDVPAQAGLQVPQDVPAQAGLQVPQDVPAQAGLRVPQDVPAQAGLRVPQDVPAQAGLQVPQDVPAQAGLWILQDVPAQAGLQVSQDVPAQAGLRVPQDVPAQAGLQVPQDVPAQAGLQILQDVRSTLQRCARAPTTEGLPVAPEPRESGGPFPWQHFALRTILKELSVDVTLNPETAPPNLVVSADGRSVRFVQRRRGKAPGSPRRLRLDPCVLATEGFTSGRHYWEAEVGDKTDWSLGVRRGPETRQHEPAPALGCWTLRLRKGDRYAATSPSSSTPLDLRVKPKRVGVFLDYEAGTLSFYSVADRSHIHTFTETFTEKLWPVFHPGIPAGRKNAAPLTLRPPTDWE